MKRAEQRLNILGKYTKINVLIHIKTTFFVVVYHCHISGMNCVFSDRLDAVEIPVEQTEHRNKHSGGGRQA